MYTIYFWQRRVAKVTNTKYEMAGGVECSGVSSHILSKSMDNIHESASKKCSEYETVLDEHGSA
jgi:hypothetical protein